MDLDWGYSTLSTVSSCGRTTRVLVPGLHYWSWFSSILRWIVDADMEDMGDVEGL